MVTSEAAWEPRLRIIGLMQRMADVKATDERGEPLPVADAAAQLEIPTSGEAPAVKLDLPLRLPPREVRADRQPQGQADGHDPRPDRDLPLHQAGRGEKRSAADRRRHRDVGRGPPRTTRRGRCACWPGFDDAGDALASHRTWIFSNQAYLEGPDGKPIAYDTYETTRPRQERGRRGLSFQPRPAAGRT